jgi:hypothetical protein
VRLLGQVRNPLAVDALIKLIVSGNHFWAESGSPKNHRSCSSH